MRARLNLFEQVVGKAAAQLEELSRDMIKKELEDPSVGVENEKRLLEFLWSNREEAVILMENPKGQRMRDF